MERKETSSLSRRGDRMRSEDVCSRSRRPTQPESAPRLPCSGRSRRGGSSTGVPWTSQFIVRPEWAEHEYIRSFAGHPLLFQDNLLGVTGIFSRRPLDQQEFSWLGLFANHAAVAIANARAFEEVDRLQGQLKCEYGPDGAAAILGMKPTTLISRMKKMNLQTPQSA
jgi:transcriptional regulator with GAF, ATPase, and Fis domain